MRVSRRHVVQRQAHSYTWFIFKPGLVTFLTTKIIAVLGLSPI